SLKNYIGWSVSTWFNRKTCLFQADPHPANFIIRKNGKITCIDLGLIGEVNEGDLFTMKKALLALYSKNTEEIVKWCLRMCKVEEEKYAHKIKKDFQKFSEDTNNSLGYWFIGPVKIFIKHKIPVPLFLSAFGRGSIVYDGTIKFFNPEITTLDLIEDELKKGLKKEVLNNIKEIKFGQIIYDLSEKAKKCPEKINQIINKFYDDPEKLINEFRKVIAATV
ncbi:hypothetical protein HY837_05440, partial [archaeon]|nr:hypothetical protein [archaeon]